MKMKIFFLFLLLLPSPVFAGEGVLKIYIKNATTGLVKVWVNPHRIVTRCEKIPSSGIFMACLADPTGWMRRRFWVKTGLISTALPDRMPRAQTAIDPGEIHPIFFKKGQHLFFCFNVSGPSPVTMPGYECMMAAFRMVDIPTRGHLMFTVAGSGAPAGVVFIPFSASHFSIIEGRKK